MLTLTPAATTAVSSLLDNPELPESAIVRLQRGMDANGQTAIGIAIVAEPDPEDEPVPAGSAAGVFLAPDVAELLDDQVLDAEIQDEMIAFTIHPQPMDGQPPRG